MVFLDLSAHAIDRISDDILGRPVFLATADVVNEALADNGDEILRSTYWTQIIGPDFIAMAFKFAHEADPDAILRYNDYGLENPAKREKLKKLIKELQDQNIPVHAIGTQTHINVSTTFEQMDETLADLASIGLPVAIPEPATMGLLAGRFRVRGSINFAGQELIGTYVAAGQLVPVALAGAYPHPGSLRDADRHPHRNAYRRPGSRSRTR